MSEAADRRAAFESGPVTDTPADLAARIGSCLAAGSDRRTGDTVDVFVRRPGQKAARHYLGVPVEETLAAFGDEDEWYTVRGSIVDGAIRGAVMRYRRRDPSGELELAPGADWDAQLRSWLTPSSRRERPSKIRYRPGGIG